jgi:hypothetical protein
MKVTLHVEGKNASELAQGLRAHLALFDAAAASNGGPSPAPTRNKTAKGASTEDAVEPETFDDAVESESDNSDAGFESGSDENDADTEPTPTLKDVQAQCQKYAKKFGEDKAIARLKKLGTPNVRKAPESDYAKIIAGMKV